MFSSGCGHYYLFFFILILSQFGLQLRNNCKGILKLGSISSILAVSWNEITFLIKSANVFAEFHIVHIQDRFCSTREVVFVKVEQLVA